MYIRSTLSNEQFKVKTCKRTWGSCSISLEPPDSILATAHLSYNCAVGVWRFETNAVLYPKSIILLKVLYYIPKALLPADSFVETDWLSTEILFKITKLLVIMTLFYQLLV